MISSEAVILFIGVLIAASLAVYTLSSFISSSTGKSMAVSQQALEKTTNAFSIVNINEQNLYVRGEFGEIDLNKCAVLVDGATTTGTWHYLYDKGSSNVLDPGDLAVYTFSTMLSSGTHTIEIHCPTLYRSIEVTIP